QPDPKCVAVPAMTLPQEREKGRGRVRVTYRMSRERNPIAARSEPHREIQILATSYIHSADLFPGVSPKRAKGARYTADLIDDMGVCLAESNRDQVFDRLH